LHPQASPALVFRLVTGRSGYAPADLLKLYIYGYLNRVRSSRRLEAETHRNIEVIIPAAPEIIPDRPSES